MLFRRRHLRRASAGLIAAAESEAGGKAGAAELDTKTGLSMSQGDIRDDPHIAELDITDTKLDGYRGRLSELNGISTLTATPPCGDKRTAGGTQEIAASDEPMPQNNTKDDTAGESYSAQQDGRAADTAAGEPSARFPWCKTRQFRVVRRS